MNGEQTTISVQPPEVTIIQPPPDYTFLWVSGVAVPLIIAFVGWWLTHKKKN